MNYYEILEVAKDASEEEIKKSYKRLALLYHPDKNRGNEESSEKFKKIAEAYGVLGTKDKREQYDMMGTYEDIVEDPFSVFNSIFKQHVDSFMNMKYEKDINIGNLFNNISGMNMNQNPFAFGNVRIKVHTFPTDIYQDSRRIDEEYEEEYADKPVHNKPVHDKPDDIVYTVRVSFADIYNQSTKKVTVTRQRKKNGLYKETNKTFDIPIYGKEVLLEECGHELKDYRKKGDVIINILNKKDKVFRRINEYDMLMIKEIDFNKIYSDLSYDIILPHGRVVNVISRPLVEQNHMLQKILDMGIPYMENNKECFGTLYVIYKIVYPKTLDKVEIVEPNEKNADLSDSYNSYECEYDELFKNE